MINYFQTDSTDTGLLNDWVRIQYEHTRARTGRYGHYCVVSNNCATFSAAGLVAGGAVTGEQEQLSVDPNIMYMQLRYMSNASYELDWAAQQFEHQKACVTTDGPNGPDTTCED